MKLRYKKDKISKKKKVRDEVAMGNWSRISETKLAIVFCKNAIKVREINGKTDEMEEEGKTLQKIKKKK